MKHHDYTYLGTTESLCPECLRVVRAKIIERRGRVYFRKRCPQHGEREDFVCSDTRLYDQLEYTVPSRLPNEFGVLPNRGCPFDCGLCTEHEQHTCIGLVEITSSCNLTCPMCFAASSPAGKHLSFEQCQRAIDRLVAVEGRPEVLQLSGGEPTIHPDFPRILEYAVAQPIDYIQINTNGLRFAGDPHLVELVARYRDRVEIYFQLDGLSDTVSRALRGEELLARKLAAINALGQANVHITLAVTLQGGVNDDQLGPLVRFGIERPWITGISFQPATYSGRSVAPPQLEQRITFPDVIHGIEQQTDGMFRAEDFMPLPCAHPNCHSVSYAYRRGTSVVPLMRFIDARHNPDLLATGISFTRAKSQELLLSYLGRRGCCEGNCGSDKTADAVTLPAMYDGDKLPDSADEFFRKGLAGELGAADVFRITITSFLDAYNFDIRRLMKCCTHHILPSGHVIPFCAYNVLYRPGHVPLPQLSLQQLSEAIS